MLYLYYKGGMNIQSAYGNKCNTKLKKETFTQLLNEFKFSLQLFNNRLN